ncbi:MAG: hypothetical protein GF315_06760 [candidate division Zixibacteria bacterium]|nr:hypothetical protein [candidate division Zixibacteria bacterium]
MYRKKRKPLKRTPHTRGVKLKRNKKFLPSLDTNAGVKVRSHYEKVCADFLHENNVEFIYEPLIIIEGKKYRPDFYLPEYDLFIEICGYNHMPFYRDRIKFKRELYRKNNMRSEFISVHNNHNYEQFIRKRLSLIINSLSS